MAFGPYSFLLFFLFFFFTFTKGKGIIASGNISLIGVTSIKLYYTLLKWTIEVLYVFCFVYELIKQC